MTPPVTGMVTPRTGAGVTDASPGPRTPEMVFGAEVGDRIKAAMDAARNRRRRSSAIKKGNCDISQAMQQAAERRRRSMAKKMQASPDAAIKEAMDRARGRHRQSISKAAEVLDDADLGS